MCDGWKARGGEAKETEKDSFGLCKQNNPAVRVVACGGRRRYEGGAGPGLRL